MSTSELNNTLHNASSPLMFDSTKLPYRNLYLSSMDIISAIYVPLLLFGITGNILNIVVFVKTSGKDNVTVSFLALSTSDLLYLVLISPHIIVTSVTHFVQIRRGLSIKWQIDPSILRYPFYWYAFVFYELSILITVYISIVRCACVLIPFKVKNTFTNRRAVIVFITFFLILFVLRLPMFLKKRIIQKFDPESNKTQLVYKEIDDGGLAEMLNDIVSRNILNWASFMIVVTCVATLVIKLKASAKFRSAVTAPKHSQSTATEIDTKSTEDHTDTVASGIGQLKMSKSCTDEDANKKLKRSPLTDRANREMLSPREFQAVRSVILVAIVFITCQAPLMAYTLARRFESHFDDSDNFLEANMKKYIFLFSFCSNVSKLFAMINASVNVFVYYKFNSRYRQSMRFLNSKK